MGSVLALLSMTIQSNSFTQCPLLILLVSLHKMPKDTLSVISFRLRRWLLNRVAANWIGSLFWCGLSPWLRCRRIFFVGVVLSWLVFWRDWLRCVWRVEVVVLVDSWVHFSTLVWIRSRLIHQRDTWGMVRCYWFIWVNGGRWGMCDVVIRGGCGSVGDDRWCWSSWWGIMFLKPVSDLSRGCWGVAYWLAFLSLSSKYYTLFIYVYI